MPKFFFTFEKGEAVRWLGHLDILRTFERAIRRATLPIAFSNGFNPRERLVFASALSTGVTGAAEPAMLELTDEREPEEVARSLNAVLPEGIRIRSCERLPDAGARDRIGAIDRGEYRVLCACPPETTRMQMADAIERVLTQPEILVTRQREGRSREVNIRPLIHSLGLAPDSFAGLPPGRVAISLVIALTDSGTGRPGEVVETLAGLVPGLALRRCHRVRLFAPETETVREIEFTAA
jgi:radical SAM-linked protein